VIEFSDVPPDHWAYTYVQYMACNNIMTGYPDGTFHPDYTATRGQFSKVIVLAEQWPIDTSGGPHFSDVPQSNTFYPYVETAYHRNIINGYPNGTFLPNNGVTRGQLSKMIVLARNWPINTSGGPHFSDVPPNNTFYPYIETAYHYGIINGYPDGSFGWGNSSTRAQIAKMVYLALSQP
jgi:hypothetical protein